MKQLAWSIVLLLGLAGSAFGQGQNFPAPGGSAFGTPPATPNGVTFTACETPSGGAAGALGYCWPGVAIRTNSTTSDTIAANDRGSCIVENNAGAIAVSVAGSGTANFANNFTFCLKDIGAGTSTITPGAGQISGNNGTLGATLAVATGQTAYCYSDNTNYQCTVVNVASGTVTTTGSPANTNCAFFSGATMITGSGNCTLDSSGNIGTNGNLNGNASTNSTSNITNINFITGGGGANGILGLKPSTASGAIQFYNSASGFLGQVENSGVGTLPIVQFSTGTQIMSGADYTNSTTTPSTLFSWSLPATAAAKTYRYTCDITWRSTNTTLIGPVLGINMSAAPTQDTSTVIIYSSLSTYAPVETYISNATTGHQNVATGAAAAVTNTDYNAKMYGTIEGAPTAGSTFIIDAAATNGTTATLNIRRGSGCTLN